MSQMLSYKSLFVTGFKSFYVDNARHHDFRTVISSFHLTFLMIRIALQLPFCSSFKLLHAIRFQLTGERVKKKEQISLKRMSLK